MTGCCAQLLCLIISQYFYFSLFSRIIFFEVFMHVEASERVYSNVCYFGSNYGERLIHSHSLNFCEIFFYESD